MKRKLFINKILVKHYKILDKHLRPSIPLVDRSTVRSKGHSQYPSLQILFLLSLWYNHHHCRYYIPLPLESPKCQAHLWISKHWLFCRLSWRSSRCTESIRHSMIGHPHLWLSIGQNKDRAMSDLNIRNHLRKWTVNLMLMNISSVNEKFQKNRFKIQF